MHGSTAIVLLAGSARPPRVLHAVICGYARLLLEAVAPRGRTVRRRGPPTRGLVGRLPQERGDPPFPRLSAPRRAEAREHADRCDERVVGVESLGSARRIVAVQQHLLEERLGYDGRYATAAARRSSMRAVPAASASILRRRAVTVAMALEAKLLASRQRYTGNGKDCQYCKGFHAQIQWREPLVLGVLMAEAVAISYLSDGHC